MTVVTAAAENVRAAFVVSDPPTGEDILRLTRLAALPGLRCATWSAAPGESSR